MSVTLASKYSDKVDERYKLKSLTDSAVNQDYDWAGVNAVVVYNVAVPTLNNYTRSGTSRYGTPGELDNTPTTYTLSQDKSFTYTIDRGNWSETQYAMEAGRSLARTVDEVVVPFVDMYRLGVLNTTAHTTKNHTPTIAAITSSNAYSIFLEAQALLDNAKVPKQFWVLKNSVNCWKPKLAIAW
jgi:hypothetical protein